MDGYNNNYGYRPVGTSPVAFLTIRNLLKVLAGFGILFYLVPVFSAGSWLYSVSISGLKATFGMGGLNAWPLAILLLFLVIGLMVVLFIKAIPRMASKITVLSIAGADLLGWIIFFCAVNAKYNISIGFGFAIVIFFKVVQLLIAILIMVNVLQLDTNIVAFFTSDRVKKAFNGSLSAVSNAVNSVADSVSSAINSNNDVIIGYCQNCGSPLKLGNNVCTNCGMPMPADVIAKGQEIAAQMAEQARREAEARAAAMNNNAYNQPVMPQQGMPVPPQPQGMPVPPQPQGMPVPPQPQGMPMPPQPQGMPMPQQPQPAAPVQPQAPTAGAGTFCKSCGAPLEPGMLFCNKCGAKQ